MVYFFYISHNKFLELKSSPKAQDSPKVGGFGFLSTPSPGPGVDESPFITWGSVEGTPLRLDNESPSTTPGPSFRLSELSTRDKIALGLAERSNSKKKQKTPNPLLNRNSTPLRSSATPISTPQSSWSNSLRATYATPKKRPAPTPSPMISKIMKPTPSPFTQKTPSTPNLST